MLALNFFPLIIIFACVNPTKISVDLTEIEFDLFLGLFENCTVHLYNYNVYSFRISRTPVVIHMETTFRINDRYTNQARIPDNCIAAVYIFPTAEHYRSDNFNDDFFEDDFNRLTTINTENRYDIVLTYDKRKVDQVWILKYFKILTMGRQSKGLIFQISNTSDLNSMYVSNEFEIVNQFHVSPIRPLVTETADLKPILLRMERRYLDEAVKDVNDFSKNKDVEWSFEYYRQISNFPPHMSIDEILATVAKQDENKNHNGRWILEHFRNGYIPSPTEAINFVKHYGKGAENFIIALTALGSGIKVDKLERYPGEISYLNARPRILFDVPNGPILSEQIKKELGFVTCSKFGSPVFKSYSLLESVQNLLSIFESKVYYSALLSYVVPAGVLGILYHGLVKKRIKKEHWITWHPFMWGLRALIGQAGNRKFNSLRFGWTTFMVIPWILVAVILSSIFQKHVWNAMGQRGRLIYPKNTIKALFDSGVTLTTDNFQLARSVPKLEFRRVDWILENEMRENSGIAFIGWMEDIEKLADGIGRGCRGSSSGTPKVGNTNIWNLYFLSKRYIYGLETNLVRGWIIQNWVDNRILKRFNALEGPSGIVVKWREVLSSMKEDRAWRRRSFRKYAFISRISFMGNILYLFYCGAGGLVLSLMVWIAEWVLYLLYTRPRQKWKREIRFERKIKEEIIDISVTERGTVSSCEELEEEIIDELMENGDLEEKQNSLLNKSFYKEENEIENECEFESTIENEDLGNELESSGINAFSDQLEPKTHVLDLHEKDFEQNIDFENVHLEEKKKSLESSCWKEEIYGSLNECEVRVEKADLEIKKQSVEVNVVSEEFNAEPNILDKQEQYVEKMPEMK